MERVWQMLQISYGGNNLDFRDLLTFADNESACALAGRLPKRFGSEYSAPAHRAPNLQVA